MIIGIVGAEGAKFTYQGEQIARDLIRMLLDRPDLTLVVSGGCHLGGADIFAEEEAKKLQIPTRIHKPKQLSWDQGYKPRNILIAQDSDELHNIVVDVLPSKYTGMRFPKCYHCNNTDHIKSGGCWTANYADKLGKTTFWHIIPNG